MSDEEDYNSEEDADYVPSDGELGSEEENSGEEEDLSVLAAVGESALSTSKRKTRENSKKGKAKIAPRKRQGGIKLDREESADTQEEKEDVEKQELAEKIKQETEQKKEAVEKKRADDLWASFMSDVRPAPRQTPSTALASVTKSKASSTQSSSPASSVPSNSSRPKVNGDKVTITKVFDFAGEEIKVTKEVDVNSKEAQAELKKQQQSEGQSGGTSNSTTTTTTTVPSPAASTTTCTPASGLTAVGVKRPAPGGGLSGVLGKIGKKQKMGTLEKSKLDWDVFKKKEGIEEDLKIHNKGKDGYIERMAFLNRADVRQFEIERDLRLSKSGKR